METENKTGRKRKPSMGGRDRGKEGWGGGNGGSQRRRKGRRGGGEEGEGDGEQKKMIS